MEKIFIIDPLNFAQNKKIQRGKIAQNELTRLRDLVNRDEGFSYIIEGDMNKFGKLLLRLLIKGKIVLQCHRCLDELAHEIDIDAILILVKNENELEAYDLDNTVDAVLAVHELDVGVLIEDEIILSLPISPRHEEEACGVGIQSVAKQEHKGSPFSSLITLKQIH